MINIPFVSIITIVYNGEKHLERCIKSVVNQEFTNYEHILIDGGSKDNSVSIAKTFENHFTVIISEKDKGISDAFNKGLKLVRGEYVAFLNADDWYEKNTLSNLVQAANGSDVLYGKLQLWSGSKKGYLVEANHLLLHREMTINHPSTFVKREMFEKFGNFNLDISIAMDFDFFARLYSGKASFQYIPELVVNMADDGKSNVNFIQGINEVRKIKKARYGAGVVADLHFVKQYLAIMASRYLPSFIVKIYRKRLSPIVKTQ